MRRINAISVLLVPAILLLTACPKEKDDKSFLMLGALALAAGSGSSGGTLCSGPMTGTYYSYAGGIVDAMTSTMGGSYTNMSTNGSLANATNMAAGTCDLAIVQEDVFQYLRDNAGSSATNLQGAVRMERAMSLYFETVHLLVSKTSGITTMADLNGKKVNLGQPDSGTYVTAKTILNTYGSAISMTESNTAPADAVALVNAGTIDATFYVVAAPAAKLNDTALTNVNLIAAIPNAGSGVFAYDAITLAANTYPWQTAAVTNNLSVRSVLAITSKIDQTKLASFIDAAFANMSAYATAYSPKWSELSKADNLKSMLLSPVAWSDAAVEYFSGKKLASSAGANICSASATGTYTKVADDLIANATSDLGTFTNMNTNGSVDNASKVFDGTCGLAIVQSDLQDYLYYNAAANSNTYTVVPDIYMQARSLRTIAPLYDEQIHLVVNTSSGINALTDITTTTKLNIGAANSGTLMTAVNILVTGGVGSDIPTALTMDDAATALTNVDNGTYDAMFLVGKAPISTLANTSLTNIKLVAVTWTNPFSSVSSATTIAASNYPFQSADVTSNAQVKSVLVASVALDQTNVDAFMAKFFMMGSASGTTAGTWAESTGAAAKSYLTALPFFYNMKAAEYIMSNY